MSCCVYNIQLQNLEIQKNYDILIETKCNEEAFFMKKCIV